METGEVKRYTILCLAFLFILRVLSCSIIPESSSTKPPRCGLMNTKPQISTVEAETFLKDWVEYIQKGHHAKVSDKISLMEGSLEDHIPLSVKLWFNAKCWTAERFYYVEDRLRAAVQTLYLKRHSAGIMAILKDRMNGENADEYKNMIEMQNQISNIENISDDELKFVEMREAEIIKILNIK